jgi:ankyrin repeat protein
MSLLRLPNELLDLILADLYDNVDLSAITETNHRLRDVAVERFCKHPQHYTSWLVEWGRKEILSEVIKGARRPIEGLHLDRLLLFAINKGVGEIIDLLLQAAKSNPANSNLYCRALHHAADHGHPHAVELVLRASPVIDDKIDEHDYRTPALRAASEKGFDEIVKLLLDAGALANDHEDGCISAIQFAAKGGHEGIVRRLLEAGADVDSHGDPMGCSPLHLASEKGHEEVVKLYP